MQTKKIVVKAKVHFDKGWTDGKYRYTDKEVGFAMLKKQLTN